MEEKKMRVDKVKNVSKVLSEAIKNPLKSQENIAKDLWIWLWTVNRAMQEMEKNGSIAKIPAIEDICDDDFQIVKLTQKETIRRLKDEEEMKKITMQDLNRAWDVSTKRYAMFKWDITNKEWWIKQPDIIFQIINPNGEENN